MDIKRSGSQPSHQEIRPGDVVWSQPGKSIGMEPRQPQR
jgi:hypothetical protein